MYTHNFNPPELPSERFFIGWRNQRLTNLFGDKRTVALLSTRIIGFRKLPCGDLLETRWWKGMLLVTNATKGTLHEVLRLPPPRHTQSNT